MKRYIDREVKEVKFTFKKHPGVLNVNKTSKN